MKLTESDRSVLACVRRACREYDGYIPHGSADWTAIRRLVARGLVEYAGFAVCCDCDSGAHHDEETELPSYRLTELGRAETGEDQ